MVDQESIRTQLAGMRDELRSRLDRIEAHQHRKDHPLDPDFEEQAVEQQNDEVVTALDGVSQQLLQRVELALKRLDSGEYENCRTCGEPIDAGRLQAIPYADTCISCAEKAESQ